MRTKMAPEDYARLLAWKREADESAAAARSDETLRERKKRLTRQQISDTALWLFCERGFDAVRVADIAAEVGVSEKTVFNYFPTKESLVWDEEEEATDALVAALRERPADMSPTEAVVELVEREWDNYGDIPDEAAVMLQVFDELVQETPALLGAQRAMINRMVAALSEPLAEEAQLDPLDPEPQVVAQALMGLWEVRNTSSSRHVAAGLRGAELRAAVSSDTHRAAQLLDSGLWNFTAFVQGKRSQRQIAEAARALDDARKQVTKAMRDAREAWTQAREMQHELRGQQRGRDGRGPRGGGGPGGPRGGGRGGGRGRRDGG